MAIQKTSIITVDLSSGNVSGQFLNYTTMDINTATLQFQLQGMNSTFSLTNATPKISMLMDDGSEFVEVCTITDPVKGVIEFTLTEDQIKHSGKVEAQFYLIYPDSSIGSFPFSFRINLSQMDMMSVPAQTISTLQGIDIDGGVF